MRPTIAALLAIFVGVVAWELVLPPGVRREAWDLPAYWHISYPAMIAASVLAGTLATDRPWRWGLLTCLAQAAWALGPTLLTSGMAGLLPVGLVAFALLSLPCMAAAQAGAWIAKKSRRG